MIEQVLYRRTVEQGYNEYCSRGLSKEEAHRVNIVMDTIASNISDLGSGADSPFMLYPFETMHKVCLATFQREFSKGRSNSVNHGLLINDAEYKEIVKNPEQLWGFTNKNFLSRKVNHREEMFALKALDVSNTYELNKESIIQAYKLNNNGYLKLLNAIYTSLSKNKNYSCGLRIDNSKDANKVMRHLGYLIMSMLPFELRDKFSACSRSVPDSIGVTVQILQEKDSDKTDIIYDVNTGECLVNNTFIEIIDFYLNDLLAMSDAALRNYFGILDAFKNELKVSDDSEAEYVISKLLKLSQNPSMFASETAERQLTFINDVFSLATSNTDLINSIVVRLMPFVASEHYMEAFDINFRLYRKLNAEKEVNKKSMIQIEENLINNYNKATKEEKKQLFTLVFRSEELHEGIYKILEKFVETNNVELDMLLVNEYIKLYEEFFGTEWMSALHWKIVRVFKKYDISNKEKIWNRIYNSTNSDAKLGVIYDILHDEDELFYKVIFNTLVDLFIKSNNLQMRERCYSCINEVIHKEDDEYRLKILREYNDVDEVEDSLWIETYNAIEDYQRAVNNIDFLNCLKDKYYKSSNIEICNLYLQYLDYASISELESIICQYGNQAETTEREDYLINEVIYFLIKDKKKISIDVLKVLASIVKDEGVNELASYISAVYLSDSSASSIEIYEFLETEQERIFNNVYLNKEFLSSFDSYWATKLDKRVLKDDEKFVKILYYLENLQYHSESYTKIINLIYHKWIGQEIVFAKTDYERYMKCKELCDRLTSIVHTQFGKQYYFKLKNLVKNGFWEASNSNTFDYKNYDIYRANSIVYDQQFRNHKNHILAENISGLMADDIDWDQVYEILLSKKYIPQDGIRKEITEDFKKRYRDKGMDRSNQNYIAFICVNTNDLSMDYSMLFKLLQKNNHQIDDQNIRELKIFHYIKGSDQLKKKISQYKNYQSENPSYNEVFKELLIEQFLVLFLLFVNNFLREFVVKMSENLKTRNFLLLCNYTGYILLIALVAIVSILLMKQANKRISSKYDKYVFGLLIINMLISSAVILFSAKFTNMIICLPATIIFMVIAIVLNRKTRNMIGKLRNK